jgi:hypothetical protein
VAKLLESSSLPEGHFLTKIDSATSFIALPHSRGSEVLCGKVLVVNMGARDKEPMNLLLVR